MSVIHTLFRNLAARQGISVYAAVHVVLTHSYSGRSASIAKVIRDFDDAYYISTESECSQDVLGVDAQTNEC